MTMIIHHIPALTGDCFLIEPDNGNCILIDCGFQSTYHNELKLLLVRLRNKGCRIVLMIITHIDDDHIGGAIPLISENGDATNPQVIPIDNIWFNGLFDICMKSNKIRSHILDELPDEDSEKIHRLKNRLSRMVSAGDGYISATRAETFEKLCRSYHYNICSVSSGVNEQLGGYSIRVLSPGEKELHKFENWIDSNLIDTLGRNYRLGKRNFIDFIMTMIMACGKDNDTEIRKEYISLDTEGPEDWLNTSRLAEMNAVNRASIVADIRYNGLKLLFTGDSESADWIERAATDYDLVKISHHGTTRPNLSLLQHIHMSRALISTNGLRNDHPENEFLARLITSGVKDIYFNYNVRQKDKLILWQKDYSYRAHFCEHEVRLKE